jgi:hypothetical protein
MPTFCGVYNTSKHSVQISAVQTLKWDVRQWKAIEENISFRTNRVTMLQGGAKLVLQNVHFFSFILKLRLGSEWGFLMKFATSILH